MIRTNNTLSHDELQVLDMEDCHNAAAACCACLPASLHSLSLRRCSGVGVACLAGLGDLAALECLRLEDVPAVCSRGARWLARRQAFHLTQLAFSASPEHKVSGPATSPGAVCCAAQHA